MPDDGTRPPALPAPAPLPSLLRVRRERAHLPGALAPAARPDLRRDGLRGEHGVGRVHGRPRDREPGCRRRRRPSAPAARLVRRRRGVHRDHRAADARGIRDPAACLHVDARRRGSGAGRAHGRPVCDRVRRSHRAHGADGRDAAAHYQVLADPRRRPRHACEPAVRHQHRRGDCRHARRRPDAHSALRHPRVIHHGRDAEPDRRGNGHCGRTPPTGWRAAPLRRGSGSPWGSRRARSERRAATLRRGSGSHSHAGADRVRALGLRLDRARGRCGSGSSRCSCGRPSTATR